MFHVGNLDGLPIQGQILYDEEIPLTEFATSESIEN